jgi:hypothetical protein
MRRRCEWGAWKVLSKPLALRSEKRCHLWHSALLYQGQKALWVGLLFSILRLYFLNYFVLKQGWRRCRRWCDAWLGPTGTDSAGFLVVLTVGNELKATGTTCGLFSVEVQVGGIFKTFWYWLVACVWHRCRDRHIFWHTVRHELLSLFSHLWRRMRKSLYRDFLSFSKGHWMQNVLLGEDVMIL